MILPGLLTFTILADYVWAVLVTEVVLSITIIATTVVQHHRTTNLLQVCHKFSNCLFPARVPCVSTTRTWVLVFTVIAILGVDFTIFPRRFAKTETYGTGLMDVGVGCFIICHGSVAKEARFPVASSVVPSCSSYFGSVVSCLRKLVPTLVIGFVRIFSVRATDYQMHVSEYGVHWNFFFTIAAVKVSVMINSVILIRFVLAAVGCYCESPAHIGVYPTALCCNISCDRLSVSGMPHQRWLEGLYCVWFGW